MTETAGIMRNESGPKPEQSSDEISLLDLMIAIGRKKQVVVITVIVAIVVGLLLSFLLPTKYTATTTLLPPQHQGSLSSMLSSQLGGLGAVASLAGGSLGLKNPNDMYVAMFRSQTVEDAMVRKYGLMREYHVKLLSQARKAFEGSSSVDGSSKDGLIHISVTDRNPQRAAELANGWVKTFHDLSDHLAITEAAQRRLFYQQQMDAAKKKLTDAEVALEDTEEKSGMINISGQAEGLIQSGIQLKAQIAAKKAEIQGMESFAAPGNPNLIQARQELQALESQLANLAGKGGNPADDLLVPKGKLPSAGLEYFRKYRDVQYDQAIFDILAKQFEVAKLDEAREGALIQVVDPALPPDHKSSPKRALIMIGCFAGGIFLGLFLALALAGWENINKDSRTREQIEAFRDSFRWKKTKVTS